MTLKEAEENYKFVNGNEGYYMWHEIGEKAYNEYKAMQIPREVKAGWDEEMVEKAFDRLTASGPTQCESGDVRIIIDAISRSYTKNNNLYAARLLNVILKKTEINDLDRIYLIEDFGHQGYHNAPRPSCCRSEILVVSTATVSFPSMFPISSLDQLASMAMRPVVSSTMNLAKTSACV